MDQSANIKLNADTNAFDKSVQKANSGFQAFQKTVDKIPEKFEALTKTTKEFVKAQTEGVRQSKLYKDSIESIGKTYEKTVVHAKAMKDAVASTGFAKAVTESKLYEATIGKLAAAFRGATADANKLSQQALPDTTKAMQAATKEAGILSKAFGGLFKGFGEAFKAVNLLSTINDVSKIATTGVSGLSKALDQLSGLDRIPQLLGLMESLGMSTAPIQNFTLLGEAIKGNEEAINSFSLSAVNAFTQFESRLTQINTIFQKSKEELASYGKSIQDLVNGPLQNMVSSVDALSGAYEVMSGGFVEAKQTQDVLTAGLKLATVGYGESGEVLRLLVKTMQAYGYESGRAMQTAAELNAVVQYGITTIPELTQNFGQVASVAKAAGLGIQELGAAVSVLTTKGTSTSSALTGIEALLRVIIDKTPQAEKALAELSASSGKVLKVDTQALREKGLVGILQDLNTAAKGNAQVLAEIIPESLAYSTAIQLMSNNAENFYDITQKFNETTAADFDKVFEGVTEDRAKRFEAIVNRFQELMIEFGQMLTPLFEGALNTIEGFANAIDSIPDPIKNAIGSLLIFYVTTNQVKNALGTLIGTFIDVTKQVIMFRAVNLLMDGKLLKQIDIIKELAFVNKDYLGALREVYFGTILKQQAQAKATATAAAEASASQTSAAAKTVEATAAQANAAAIDNETRATTAQAVADKGWLATAQLKITELKAQIAARFTKTAATTVDTTAEAVNTGTTAANTVAQTVNTSAVAANTGGIIGNTIGWIANTKAKFANSGATSILAIAQKGLAFAMKGVTAAASLAGKAMLAMLANPVVLAAAAAIGLAVALLHDQFFGASAQIRKYNKELDKFVETQAETEFKLTRMGERFQALAEELDIYTKGVNKSVRELREQLSDSDQFFLAFSDLGNTIQEQMDRVAKSSPQSLVKNFKTAIQEIGTDFKAFAKETDELLVSTFAKATGGEERLAATAVDRYKRLGEAAGVIFNPFGAVTRPGESVNKLTSAVAASGGGLKDAWNSVLDAGYRDAAFERTQGKSNLIRDTILGISQDEGGGQVVSTSSEDGLIGAIAALRQGKGLTDELGEKLSQGIELETEDLKKLEDTYNELKGPAEGYIAQQQEMLEKEKDPERRKAIAQNIQDMQRYVDELKEAKDIGEKYIQVQQSINKNLRVNAAGAGNNFRESLRNQMESSRTKLDELYGQAASGTLENYGDLTNAVTTVTDQINTAFEEGVSGYETADQAAAQLRALRDKTITRKVDGKDVTQSPLEVQARREMTQAIAQIDKQASDQRIASMERESSTIQAMQRANLISEEEASKQLYGIQQRQSEERLATLDKQIAEYKAFGLNTVELEKQAANMREQIRLQELTKVEEDFRKAQEKLKKQYENSAQEFAQSQQKALNQSSLASGTLQYDRTALEAEKSMAQTINESEEAQIQRQLSLTKDVEKRAQLETQMAELKLANLQETQAFERESLKIQNQMAKLAAERDIIQNRIAKSENKVNQEKLKLEIIQAKRDKRSAEEVKALELQLSSLEEQGSLLNGQAVQLERSRVQQQEIAASTEQELAIRQQIATDGGLLDVQQSREREISAAIEQRNREYVQSLELRSKLEQTAMEAVTGAMEHQNKLLSIRKSELDSIASYVNAEANILMETTRLASDKKKIAEDLAEYQLKKLRETQAIEKQNLEIEIQKNQLALERQKIENQIAQAKNYGEQEKATAELENTRARFDRGEATESEVRAAEALVYATGLEGAGLAYAGSMLDRQGVLEENSAAIQRQNLDRQQTSEYDQAFLDYANSIRRPSERRRMQREAGRRAQDRLYGDNAIGSGFDSFLSDTSSKMPGGLTQTAPSFEDFLQMFQGNANARSAEFMVPAMGSGFVGGKAPNLTVPNVNYPTPQQRNSGGGRPGSISETPEFSGNIQVENINIDISIDGAPGEPREYGNMVRQGVQDGLKDLLEEARRRRGTN